MPQPAALWGASPEPSSPVASVISLGDDRAHNASTCSTYPRLKFQGFFLFHEPSAEEQFSSRSSLISCKAIRDLTLLHPSEVVTGTKGRQECARGAWSNPRHFLSESSALGKGGGSSTRISSQDQGYMYLFQSRKCQFQ